MKDLIQKTRHWYKQSLRLKVIAMAIVPLILIQFTVGAVTAFAYKRVTTTKLVSNRDLRLARLTAERVSTVLTEDSQHFTRMINELKDNAQDSLFMPGPRTGDNPDEGAQSRMFVLDAAKSNPRIPR